MQNSYIYQLQDLDVTNKNRRGFTDHEHLNEQQLIHMNGRVYDYNLGRFMSVDPLIQSPTSTQSVNPYSYIMNNPLAGTDPTGYCAASRIDSVCESTDIGHGGTGGERMAMTNSVSAGMNKGSANLSNGAVRQINGWLNTQQNVAEVGSLKQNSQQETEKGGTNIGGADNRYLTASTDDEQLHWGGKPTDGPKTTKTTRELETDVEFEGTLETLRATKYELQTTPSANLPDFTKTGGLPVGPGMDVAIDWNNYDVTFQVYSLYEVTTTKTSWSRETVAISSITGQKIRYHNKVSSPPKVVRTSLGRYWTIKGKTGQKVGTMKFPLPVPIPTR
jgi:RHS repeat-associated protein